jgi:hypothetical protein
MTDNVLKQFTNKLTHPHANDDEAEQQPEDLGAFGWLRGSRERATMLEVRRKDGSITALGYAWLEKAEFDPSEGITLRFTGQSVRLKGRNLNAKVRPHLQLFMGLVRHRIPWLQEADEPALMTAAKNDAVIEKVEFL